MNQESKDTHEVFMDTMVKKLEIQDSKITDIEEKYKALPNYSEDLRLIKKGHQELKSVLTNLHFPMEQLQDFSNKLSVGIDLLRRPIENKMSHHHHIPKIIWIAACLFLCLSLVCTGWYMTSSTLDQFRANDVKFRYLKLKSSRATQEDINDIDSLYHIGYAMNDSVIQWENDLQKATELNKKLLENEGEVQGLKEKLNVLEQQDSTRKKAKK